MSLSLLYQLLLFQGHACLGSGLQKGHMVVLFLVSCGCPPCFLLDTLMCIPTKSMWPASVFCSYSSLLWLFDPSVGYSVIS